MMLPLSCKTVLVNPRGDIDFKVLRHDVSIFRH